MAEGELPEGVLIFPNWKKAATPYERLMELALTAQAYPERFRKIVVVWSGDAPDNADGSKIDYHRHISAGASTAEAVGMLEIGKVRLIDESVR